MTARMDRKHRSSIVNRSQGDEICPFVHSKARGCWLKKEKSSDRRCRRRARRGTSRSRGARARTPCRAACLQSVLPLGNEFGLRIWSNSKKESVHASISRDTVKTKKLFFRDKISLLLTLKIEQYVVKSCGTARRPVREQQGGSRLGGLSRQQAFTAAAAPWWSRSFT